jgi:hypothetical protein
MWARSAYRPQSNELTRGTNELLSALLFTGEVHIGARALLNIKIGFGYIACLSQWGGGNFTRSAPCDTNET